MLASERDLPSGLLASLCLHVLVVAAIVVQVLIFPDEPLTFEDAIRVDLVALPERITPPAPSANLETTTPPIAEPNLFSNPPAEEIKSEKNVSKKDPPKLSEKTSKTNVKKQKTALEKLKKQSALEKLKSMNTSSTASDTPQKPTVYKGNVLSAGTALTGIHKLQHNQYLAELKKHIQKNWSLPEWLGNKGYQAQIRVKITETGEILSREFTRPSGNSNFDEVVLATIDQSSPFPPPPEKFKDLLQFDGLVLGFPN